MLTFFVFICFVFAYRWLCSAPAPEMVEVEVIAEPPIPTRAQAMAMPEAEYIISPEELELLAPVTSVSIEPAAIALAPDYHSMTSHQLRGACSAAGIKWRNAKGRNKHLTRQDMLALLLRQE